MIALSHRLTHTTLTGRKTSVSYKRCQLCICKSIQAHSETLLRARTVQENCLRRQPGAVDASRGPLPRASKTLHEATTVFQLLPALLQMLLKFKPVLCILQVVGTDLLRQSRHRLKQPVRFALPALIPALAC